MPIVDLGRVVGKDGAPGKDGVPVVNLLANSDWRIKKNIINQRGQDSYTANDYFIDRWKSWSTDSDFTVVICNGYIEINNNTGNNTTIYQRLVKGVLDENKKYTLAYKTVEGTTKIKGGGVITYGTSYDSVQIVVQPNTTLRLEWAAFYEGTYTADTLPPYVPPKYTTEFAECLGYYRQIKQAYFPVAIHNTSNRRFVISIPIDIPMVDNDIVATGVIVSPPKYLRANGTTYELNDLVVVDTTVYNGSIHLIIQTSTEIPNAHAGFIGESTFAISKDL